MRAGDLVKTVEAALSEFGEDFGPVLVTGKRLMPRSEEEVELLFSDGSIKWYPSWMVEVIRACTTSR